MGILTNKESVRSFSSYVTSFGLALLISSVIYLKRLDESKENFPCLQDHLFESSNSLFPSCAQFSAWRVAAIFGIVIGVIDALILPFIYCCLCWTAAGCALCMTFGWPNEFSEDSAQKTTDVTGNEATEATTVNIEPERPEKLTNKYDVEKLPSKIQMWMNIFGWIVWVLGPFLAALIITVTLYKYDAIRSRNDDLYNSALAVFVIGLFNLMVFFQKFVNIICGYGYKKVTSYCHRNEVH